MKTAPGNAKRTRPRPNRPHRRPAHLLRIEHTRTYVFVDVPAGGQGPARVFMGEAGDLRQLVVRRRGDHRTPGFRRVSTDRGVVYIPLSPDGVPRQPTFTAPKRTSQRLLAVAAKRGVALRAILGAELYAEQIAYSAKGVPETDVTLTVGSASRLILYRLGGAPLKRLGRYVLGGAIGSEYEQLPDRLHFRRKTPDSRVAYVRWQAGRGFVALAKPPADPVLRLSPGDNAVVVSRGNLTTTVGYSRISPSRMLGQLIANGRSLVLLQPYSMWTDTGKQVPVLAFVEDLRRPEPKVLQAPLGEYSVLMTAPEAKVFYLATGPASCTNGFFRVDPFGGRVDRVTGTQRLCCDEGCTYLHPEQVLAEKSPGKDLVVLFDLKRRRESVVKVDKAIGGITVLRWKRGSALIAVGDRLIDPRRGRVVAMLPDRNGLAPSVLDAKRGIFYYTVGHGFARNTIRAFDLARRKVVGSVKLPDDAKSRHPGHGNRFEVRHLYLLPDGSVVVIQ